MAATAPQNITRCYNFTIYYLLLYLSIPHQVSIYHVPNVIVIGNDVMQAKPYLLYNHQNYITFNEEEYIFLVLYSLNRQIFVSSICATGDSVSSMAITLLTNILILKMSTLLN